jgi:hypothetical protein
VRITATPRAGGHEARRAWGAVALDRGGDGLPRVGRWS